MSVTFFFEEEVLNLSLQSRVSHHTSRLIAISMRARAVVCKVGFKVNVSEVVLAVLKVSTTV